MSHLQRPLLTLKYGNTKKKYSTFHVLMTVEIYPFWKENRSRPRWGQTKKEVKEPFFQAYCSFNYLLNLCFDKVVIKTLIKRCGRKQGKKSDTEKMIRGWQVHSWPLDFIQRWTLQLFSARPTLVWEPATPPPDYVSSTALVTPIRIITRDFTCYPQSLTLSFFICKMSRLNQIILFLWVRTCPGI